MSLRSINKIKNLGGSIHLFLILLRGGNELLPPPKRQWYCRFSSLNSVSGAEIRILHCILLYNGEIKKKQFSKTKWWISHVFFHQTLDIVEIRISHSINGKSFWITRPFRVKVWILPRCDEYFKIYFVTQPRQTVWGNSPQIIVTV